MPSRLRPALPAMTRWLLAWVLLAMVVATAAPLVQPLRLVCSAGGMVLLVSASDDGAGSRNAVQHTLDCALCIPGGAPPPAVAWQGAAPALAPMAPAVRPAELVRIAALVGAPLPARGPPLGTA